MSNIEFHNLILNITASKRFLSQISEHIREISDLVLQDYRDNIRLSAESGNNIAYLFIYNKDAYYKNIRIHDYLFPSEALERECLEKNIMSAQQRINNELYPFVVSHNNYSINNNIYIVISVKW